MDSVWTGKAPCRKYALDARYMLEVLDHTQSEEMFVLCPSWDLTGSRRMQTRLDGRPYEDCGYNQFGGTNKCETAVRNIETYRVLYKVH